MSADVGVEGIAVAEIVVAHEELVLAIDAPISSNVEPLRVLYLTGGCEVARTDAKVDERGLVGRGDRVRGRVGSLQMLISDKEEEFVLDDGTTDVADVVIDVEAGLDDPAWQGSDCRY